MNKYNKVIDEIKAELPQKTTWIVQVRLLDNTEVNLEYKAHSVQQVKQLYKNDLTVYNGLIIGRGASKKHIKRKHIVRVMDIIMIDSTVI